jgi:mannose-6-phosphate isomerase-like protein (cupin superfamily)
MRLGTVAAASFSAMFLTASAYAQSAPGTPVRMVLASAKLPSVTDAPLYFKVVQIALAAGRKTTLSPSTSILYQVSGSTQVMVNGGGKSLGAGEAIFIADGVAAQLEATGTDGSTLMRFALAPAGELKPMSANSSAKEKELYRTRSAIPELKSGPYDITLTKSTFPAAMPNNRPHHRTGAALYFIISGTGADTVDGRVSNRGSGSFIYEPAPLVHQWGNPGSEPLAMLQFNINPEGEPAVVPANGPAK